ncbi:MAG: TonB-dependent siderophore receptor [Polaromonas sp.]|nr:TonB-dependent siderophore receptor [Polaromonas sp.]
MTIARFILTPVASAALAMLMPTWAQAQTATAQAAATLSTVTVNASADASAEGLAPAFAGGQVARGSRVGILGSQDIMDTPFNGTSYTHDLIQDQQARSIGDVLLNDASVRLSRGFGNYQQLYVVRGLPLYSDDISYNGLYGLVPRQYMLTEFIERVDVLRGANTFVNGAAPGGSGVGGSVNLVPKRATNEAISQISFGTSSNGQGFIATDLGRRFGPDQATGIRINAITGAGGTGVDREKNSATGLSVGLDWRSSQVRLSADIGYQDRELKRARPSVTVGAGLPVPTPPDADSNFAQPWTRSESRDTFATARGEFDITPQVTAWIAGGIRRGKEDNVLTDPVTTTSASGDITYFRFDNARKDKVTTGEIGLRGQFETAGVKHTVSVSASTFEQKSRNAFEFSDSFASNIYNPVFIPAPGYSAFSTGGGSLDNPLLTLKTKTSSMALADTLSFAGDTVLLTVGLRHQKLEQYDYDYTTGAQITNADFSKSRTTPALGVVVKASPQVSVYANYVEGLRQGEQAGFGSTNNGQRLDPAASKQQEVGFKYDGGNMGGALALFTTKQPYGAIDPTTLAFVIGGEQRNRGAELTVYGQPVKGLRLLGGLTLLDAEQRTTPIPANRGKDAIGVPGQQLNLGADWDVPGIAGLSLNGRVIHTSSQYADAANTQKIASWNRLDLGARYLMDVGGKLVTLRGRIENVADKNYWASAGGYPGQSYLVLGAPRTFALTASVDF